MSDRTIAQVMRDRQHHGGCCDRYCDNQACDCLDKARLYEDTREGVVARYKEMNDDLKPKQTVGEGKTPLDTEGTRPSYYGGADNPYEVIKVLEAWLTPQEFIGWLKGTIIKYMPRAGKGQTTLDIAKAAWYSHYLAEYLKRKPNEAPRSV